MPCVVQRIALVLLFISIFCEIQSLRVHYPSAAPEIWLSSLTEVDSFEAFPAEDGFRRLWQFHNDFIYKNGTDYVVLDGTENAVFSCRARYPVEWTFPHLEQVENTFPYTFDTHVSRTSELYQNQLEPLNNHFETLLTIKFVNVNFLSVNLSCASTEMVQEPGRGGNMVQKSSSIYVYLAGKQAIENAGRTLQVYVSPSKGKDTSGLDTVTFPCRPATPNVTILLEKQIESSPGRSNSNATNTNKWIKFKVPSKYVDFDPKKGFILLKNTVGKRGYIFGLYRCIALEEGSDEDVGLGDEQDDSNRDITQSLFVFINVTSTHTPEIEDIEFESMMDLRGNASVRYNQQSFGKYPFSVDTMNYDDSMFCCSGLPGNPPEIYIDRCDNLLQCKLSKRSMSRKLHGKVELSLYPNQHLLNDLRDDCATSFFYAYAGGALVVCKAETVKFAQHFIYQFNKDLFPMAARGGVALPLSKFDTEEVVMNANLSQKIFFSIGYPVDTAQELIGNRHYDIWSGKQFPLTKQRNYEEEIYYESDARFAMPYDMRYHNRPSLAKNAEYSRDVYYEGEPLVLFCLGWRDMYTDGALLSISWKNGTITALEEPDKQKVHFMLVYFSNCNPNTASEDSLVYRFGKTITTTKDIASVHCHMPKASSSGWDILTRNLTVLESSLPKWVEGEGNITVEVVYFYLGDDEQEKQLECHLASGAPEPKINVTKDGKQILDRRDLSFNSHDHRHFLNLFNVTVISNDAADKSNSTSVVDDEPLIKIVINFSEVSHETTGVYQCIAENIRGTVTRTFKVIVTERKSITLPIFLTVIIICSVLLLGVGGRHWLKRRNLESSLRENGCR